jgi:hypothetical protein
VGLLIGAEKGSDGGLDFLALLFWLWMGWARIVIMA